MMPASAYWLVAAITRKNHQLGIGVILKRMLWTKKAIRRKGLEDILTSRVAFVRLGTGSPISKRTLKALTKIGIL